MEIDVLPGARDEELIGFLDSIGSVQLDVLAYHYPFYREMLTQIGIGKPLCLGAWVDGKLAGVLPGFVLTSDFGTAYSSLPFFGPNSGVICRHQPGEEQIHAALLGALLDKLRAEDKSISASLYTPLMFDDYKFYDNVLPSSIVVSKFTQTTPIEQIRWPQKVRYDINRAKKLGITINSEISDENLECFYTIYKGNCEEAGIPVKPREVVDILARHCGAQERVHLYFAFHEERMVAGLMTLWGPRTVSYYIPCTLAEARSLQPSSVLIDAAAQDASSHGLRLWNWESSPSAESGVFQFKKRWGAVTNDYRIYVVPFKSDEFFRDIGRQRLSEEYPHFYIYPFDRL